jgi:hypothetical protein
MQCHECGRTIQVGDRFCTGCGVSLAGVTEPTESVPAVSTISTEPSDHVDTGQLPTPEAVEHVDTGQLPPTEAVEQVDTGQLPTTEAVEQVDTGQLPTTELVERVEADAWDDDDPVWAATGSNPTVVQASTSAPIATGELPSTEPITEVWMERFEPEPDPWSDVPTGAVPATAQMPMATAVAAPATGHRFRFTAVTLLGVVGGIALLVGMFATVVEISSSDRLTIGDDTPAAFRLGTWIADDLGDNLSIAGLIAALVMVLGGVAASFGWRWGSGLAGGGGLAAAGLAALVIGLAQYPIDAAYEFADIPTDQEFVLTITKGLGYWLLVAAAAIGIVVFFAATNDAFGDRRGGLNPWIAALGALAVVVAAAGPLLPVDLAVFSDNWYLSDRPGDPPAMLLAMRLVHLGLFVIGGVVGFLSVRRWGLGVAAGATLPSIWLGVSTLFEIGSSPVGPGFRNPGASDPTLHGVTIIGLSSTLAMLILAIIAAYDQSTRR